MHIKLCSMLCASLDGRGVWGRMDTCICVAESLPCLPGTTTILLIGYFVVQLPSSVRLFVTSWTAVHRAPCPSPPPRVCPSLCPLHQWCHPAISSSDTLFCPRSFPASRTFPMSWLFSSDDQNTGASASASVFPANIQGWSLLRWTGLISLLSRGLSGVFSSTIVQSHQFCILYGPALTIVHEPWADHSFDYTDLCQQSDVYAFQHTV